MAIIAQKKIKKRKTLMKKAKKTSNGFKQLRYAPLFVVMLVASMSIGWTQECFTTNSQTLALWKMACEADSERIPDLSGGGHDLKAIKAGTLEKPKEVSGKRGKALAFEQGTACLVTAKDSSALVGRKGVTIQAWIRPTQPEQQISMIVECFNYLVGGWRFGLTKGALMLTIETPASEVGISGKADIFDGEWHLVEASHDVASGQTTLKVDGWEITKKTLKVDWPEIEKVSFAVGNGSGPGRGWYYTGEIESLKISEGTSP